MQPSGQAISLTDETDEIAFFDPIYTDTVRLLHRKTGTLPNNQWNVKS